MTFSILCKKQDNKSSDFKTIRIPCLSDCDAEGGCGDHGVCVGDGVCACHAGYTGPTCTDPDPGNQQWNNRPINMPMFK